MGIVWGGEHNNKKLRFAWRRRRSFWRRGGARTCRFAWWADAIVDRRSIWLLVTHHFLLITLALWRRRWRFGRYGRSNARWLREWFADANSPRSSRRYTPLFLHAASQRLGAFGGAGGGADGRTFCGAGGLTFIPSLTCTWLVWCPVLVVLSLIFIPYSRNSTISTSALLIK